MVMKVEERLLSQPMQIQAAKTADDIVYGAYADLGVQFQKTIYEVAERTAKEQAETYTGQKNTELTTGFNKELDEYETNTTIDWAKDGEEERAKFDMKRDGHWDDAIENAPNEYAKTLMKDKARDYKLQSQLKFQGIFSKQILNAKTKVADTYVNNFDKSLSIDGDVRKNDEAYITTMGQIRELNIGPDKLDNYKNFVSDYNLNRLVYDSKRAGNQINTIVHLTGGDQDRMHEVTRIMDGNKQQGRMPFDRVAFAGYEFGDTPETDKISVFMEGADKKLTIQEMTRAEAKEKGVTVFQDLPSGFYRSVADMNPAKRLEAIQELMKSYIDKKEQDYTDWKKRNEALHVADKSGKGTVQEFSALATSLPDNISREDLFKFLNNGAGAVLSERYRLQVAEGKFSDQMDLLIQVGKDYNGMVEEIIKKPEAQVAFERLGSHTGATGEEAIKIGHDLFRQEWYTSKNKEAFMANLQGLVTERKIQYDKDPVKAVEEFVPKDAITAAAFSSLFVDGNIATPNPNPAQIKIVKDQIERRVYEQEKRGNAVNSPFAFLQDESSMFKKVLEASLNDKNNVGLFLSNMKKIMKTEQLANEFHRAGKDGFIAALMIDDLPTMQELASATIAKEANAKLLYKGMDSDTYKTFIDDTNKNETALAMVNALNVGGKVNSKMASVGLMTAISDMAMHLRSTNEGLSENEAIELSVKKIIGNNMELLPAGGNYKKSYIIAPKGVIKEEALSNLYTNGIGNYDYWKSLPIQIPDAVKRDMGVQEGTSRDILLNRLTERTRLVNSPDGNGYDVAYIDNDGKVIPIFLGSDEKRKTPFRISASKIQNISDTIEASIKKAHSKVPFYKRPFVKEDNNIFTSEMISLNALPVSEDDFTYPPTLDMDRMVEFETPNQKFDFYKTHDFIDKDTGKPNYSVIGFGGMTYGAYQEVAKDMNITIPKANNKQEKVVAIKNIQAQLGTTSNIKKAMAIYTMKQLNRNKDLIMKMDTVGLSIAKQLSYSEGGGDNRTRNILKMIAAGNYHNASLMFDALATDKSNYPKHGERYKQVNEWFQILKNRTKK